MNIEIIVSLYQLIIPYFPYTSIAIAAQSPSFPSLLPATPVLWLALMSSPLYVVVPPTPISTPAPHSPGRRPTLDDHSLTLPELTHSSSEGSSIEPERSSSETTIVTIYSMYEEEDASSWSAAVEEFDRISRESSPDIPGNTSLPSPTTSDYAEWDDSIRAHAYANGVTAHQTHTSSEPSAAERFVYEVFDESDSESDKENQPPAPPSSSLPITRRDP